MNAIATRFHGVFAPNSKLRSQVTLSGRGKRPPCAPQTSAEQHHSTCAERRRSMNWAQRLKRVFQIDMTHCEHCPASGIPQHHGGKLKILASIEDPATIHRILEHLERHARGPPVPPATQLQ